MLLRNSLSPLTSLDAFSVPAIRGDQAVAAHEKAGFAIARVRGSHHTMRHVDGRSTTVPVHKGRDIRPGTLRGILTDVGLTVDEFRKLL